ncbi:hypothetical protein [Streptomyces sp. WAC06614]|uniref:hypothetical protein n=1 Tax=Streptomyces sp. WAC06614 TaxID=2487416 RepID=UPI000F78A7CC|nr:hypothetical protein [Streptomyces sp. WAC06614]RSS79265.1 hypothetical protein EF918_18020 [Streptomyces sp. WAC06614]
MSKKSHGSSGGRSRTGGGSGSTGSHHDDDLTQARNRAAEARARAAVKDAAQSLSAKTRGMQQKAQAKRG